MSLRDKHCNAVFFGGRFILRVEVATAGPVERENWMTLPSENCYLRNEANLVYRQPYSFWRAS